MSINKESDQLKIFVHFDIYLSNLGAYVVGSQLAKSSTERIETADDEKKTATYSIIEGDLLKYYKSFKGHLALIPDGEGCEMKWCAEYIKVSNDIPDPSIVKDFAVKNFIEVDEYVQSLAA